MPTCPVNKWREVIGLPIEVQSAEGWQSDVLECVLLQANKVCAQACLDAAINSIDVCLSGGLDSSLSLAMIRRQFPLVHINAYTIGASLSHPDVVAAGEAAAAFRASQFVYVPGFVMDPPDRANLGDIGVSLLYVFMAKHGVKSVIAHDGIDELMGGYWDHRGQPDIEGKRRAFQDRWTRLVLEHLEPLEQKAERYGIQVRLPYLQKEVVEYVARIPLDERTSREESKMPLRRMAEKYGVPKSIIERKKVGFCDCLKTF